VRKTPRCLEKKKKACGQLENSLDHLHRANIFYDAGLLHSQSLFKERRLPHMSLDFFFFFWSNLVIVGEKVEAKMKSICDGIGER